MLHLIFTLTLSAIGPASDTSVEDPRAEATRLYERGSASYVTHDFAAAIAHFTEAFSRAKEIDDEAVREQALRRLRYNLGRAHVAAFDIDAKPEHLRIARRLVDDYRGAAREAGRDPDEDTDVLELERELALREAKLEDPTAAGAKDTRPEGPAAPSGTDPSDRGSQVDRGRGLRIGGWTAVGAGMAGLGVGVAGLVLGQRSEQDFVDAGDPQARVDADNAGLTRNRMAIGGLAAGGALTLTGAILVGVGYARRGGPSDRSARLRVAPSFSLEGAGVSGELNF